MNKGLRPSWKTDFLKNGMINWENSDLMNKGLRHKFKNYLKIHNKKGRWENSDLMNKGLRQVHPHRSSTCEGHERILTWWIKDCDSWMSVYLRPRLTLPRENSDLMNKGLRQDSAHSSHLPPARAWENSDLMNKGLRPVWPGLKAWDLWKVTRREFWLDE